MRSIPPASIASPPSSPDPAARARKDPPEKSTNYTPLQLDALRELANIGSGTAGTSLSQMLGRPVDISVPTALALPLADAVDAVGVPEEEITGVVIPLAGDMQAIVLL